MNLETIKFYGYFEDNRNTPEHRLWTAVLITFIDEMIEKINQLNKLKLKLESTPSNKEYFDKSIYLANERLKDLIIIAKSDGTKSICELINIDHLWFVKNLLNIANDKNMKSRPIRQIEYDVE